MSKLIFIVEQLVECTFAHVKEKKNEETCTHFCTVLSQSWEKIPFWWYKAVVFGCSYFWRRDFRTSLLFLVLPLMSSCSKLGSAADCRLPGQTPQQLVHPPKSSFPSFFPWLFHAPNLRCKTLSKAIILDKLIINAVVVLPKENQLARTNAYLSDLYIFHTVYLSLPLHGNMKGFHARLT